MLGDLPFDVGVDPLGFHETARRLADLIIASSEASPFTLGIEGDWGSGKSSLMRRIRAELGRQDVPTVWFNPWTEEGNDALEGLIRSVLREIDDNILRKAMRAERLIGWGRLLVGLVAGWLRVGNVVDDLWERLRVSVEARNQMTELMTEAMRSWRDRTPGSPGSPGTSGTPGRLLAVFVDDLDRCSPENVLKVFEAVKLYLDVPGLVFILGYDRNVISDSILRRKSYGPSVRAVDYIEKIVQITYPLTRPDADAALRLIDGYLASAGVVSLLDPAERSLLANRNARNPRRIKRFINNFVLRYQLDAEWRELGAPLSIRGLVLEMYYPDIVHRARTGAGRDPIGEALDYAHAVRVIKRDGWRAPRDDGMSIVDETEREFLAGFFASYNLAFRPDDPARTLLEILREEVPTVVIAAAGDTEFLSLAQSLGDQAGREVLLAKLASRAPEIGIAGGTADDARPGPPPSAGAGAGSDVGSGAGAGPTVFINYRNEDTGPQAARLAESLEAVLGRDSVVSDRNLRPGTDWRLVMRAGLEASHVVLVLIGERWLDALLTKVEPTLGSTDDMLMEEIILALADRKLVIPVLVNGASLPPSSAMPPAVARISRYQAAYLRDATWQRDVDDLLEGIRLSVGGRESAERGDPDPPPPPPPAPPRQPAQAQPAGD